MIKMARYKRSNSKNQLTFNKGLKLSKFSMYTQQQSFNNNKNKELFIVCQFFSVKRYVSRNQLYRNAICAEDLRSKNRGQQRQTIHTINITVKRGKARTKRERERDAYIHGGSRMKSRMKSRCPRDGEQRATPNASVVEHENTELCS